MTDRAGQYRFAQLQPGSYAVSAELAGFTPVAFEGIELTIGFVVTQDFELRIQTVEETITVTAVTPVVDVTQIEASAVVTQEQIETLPINSRNYLSLAPAVARNQSGLGAGVLRDRQRGRVLYVQ